MNRAIINEIISLTHLRIQKIYELDHAILVFELYSPEHRRLYLVYDQGPMTRTFHVHTERPRGHKTTSPLLALLNKYAVGNFGEVHSLDEDATRVKFNFRSAQDENVCLLVEFFPKYKIGLFKNADLMAALGPAPEFRRGFLQESFAFHGLKNNFNEAIRHNQLRSELAQQENFSRQMNELKSVLHKKSTLLKNILGDKLKAENSLARAHDAELLRNNLHLLQRGMTSASVMDYSQDPPEERIITLDPRLSPKEFVDQAFAKIKKAKRGLAMISPRIDVIEQEIDQLKSELQKLENAGPTAQAPESIAPPSINRKIATTRLPYRTYLSSDNIKILVGRSAKDSDEMLKRHTNNNDWWLHTRDVPGAHVVIKCGKTEVPNRTMIEAAMLAAHFSDDKNNSSSSIQYTRVKNLRKPKGFAPGKVLVAQEKAILVDMDSETIKRLLADV